MMLFLTAWYIIPAALLLDLILGDPHTLPHPIRWMGNAITKAEPFFRRLPVTETISGAFFAILLVLGTWTLTFMLIHVAGRIHPICRIFIEIILIYYCISVRSLEREAMDVYDALTAHDLDTARQKLSFIVGRDTRNLSETGVARAAVETVAENLVDGVISPLFFVFIGGAPFAMAYKMINTLDSMIGYKNERYKDFGKVAARTDDVANFIPARLSLFLIALAAQILAKRGGVAFQTALQEGRNHTSPNAGYSEAAFAGALGVKLGGPGIYHGKQVLKPYIGTRFNAVALCHIRQACDLMILSSVWGCVLVSLLLWVSTP